MRARRTRAAASAAAAILLLVSAACADDGGDAAGDGQLPAQDAPEVVFADELQGLERDDPLQVGDIVLPDAQTGEPMAMVADEGELLIGYFGYLSCPDVCPTSMSDLEKALELLDEGDAERVTVSFTTVDPGRDTPELMADYLSFFFDRWLTLRTEDPAQLQAAEDAFLATSEVIEAPDGTIEVTHSAQLYAIDDTGTVLVEWPFGTSSDAMASDLALLLDQIDEEQT